MVLPIKFVSHKESGSRHRTHKKNHFKLLSQFLPSLHCQAIIHRRQSKMAHKLPLHVGRNHAIWEEVSTMSPYPYTMVQKFTGGMKITLKTISKEKLFYSMHGKMDAKELL